MKTLLLGLDGLDPDLVKQFDLPNIKSIGEGFKIDTYGNSGPSWATVMTGLSPNEHGVHKLLPEHDRHSWGGTPIWEKVDGYSGIANVPLTYPPAELRGYMITSLMTPQRTIYTYPPDLYKKLDDLNYRIDVWVTNNENHPNGHYGTLPFEFSEENRERLIKECDDVMNRRSKCFQWLIQNKPADFWFLCFTTLDRVQHLAFHDRSEIRRFYVMLDAYVGDILHLIPDHTEVFVTSDHGFRRKDDPNTDLTGDHRVEGYGNTNTDATFANLEHLHRNVVESANRGDVTQRLDDLGYMD